MNHIFDGIDMDCATCDVSEICNEIEGMREMHQRKMKHKDEYHTCITGG